MTQISLIINSSLGDLIESLFCLIMGYTAGALGLI